MRRHRELSLRVAGVQSAKLLNKWNRKVAEQYISLLTELYLEDFLDDPSETWMNLVLNWVKLLFERTLNEEQSTRFLITTAANLIVSK